jgi:nitroreductase
VRLYKDKPVEKEKIQRLIEIARFAPTGSNSQTVEWQVHSDRENIRRLAEITVDWMRGVMENNPDAAASNYIPLILAAWDGGFDVILRNAPALVTASAPKTSVNGMVDVSLALSYLDLATQPLGLGACWAGILQAALLASPPLKQALGIPMDHTHHYPLMLGYPKFKYYRLPERKNPKITWR